MCNYKCYLLNLTSLSIIQLFTQGCTDKGPPLKSQSLYFYGAVHMSRANRADSIFSRPMVA